MPSSLIIMIMLMQVQFEDDHHQIKNQYRYFLVPPSLQIDGQREYNINRCIQYFWFTNDH